MLYLQGLKIMRYSLHQEAKALKMQQDAVLLQAEAIRWQRQAARIRLGGLQRLEAGVAGTPSTGFHELLRGHAGLLMDNIIKERAGAPGLAAGLDVVGQHLQGAEAATAQVIPPTGEFPHHRRVIPKPLPKNLLEDPVPFLTNAAGKKLTYPATKGATKDQGKCSFPSCAKTGNKRAIEAHIRELHTKELLVCPNGESCTHSKRPLTSFNIDTLRRHYSKEGPISASCIAKLRASMAEEDEPPAGSSAPGDAEEMME